MSRVSIAFTLLCCVLLHAVSLAAPLADGPYVSHQPDGSWIARWVEGDEAAPRVREQKTALGKRLTVPSVGNLPAFAVTLRNDFRPAPDEVPLARDQAFFVVADTHGEFEIFVELLRRHGVIDEALRWSYGTGRLALLGDVFDRGPNQTEILWLIYKLEAEAARAGGGVHLVLGNHETMVLMGDERYLNPKYRKAAAALGVAKYTQLWDSQSLLGRWLRTRAAVMKVGEFLCLHGGISPDITERKLTLAAINQSVREFLDGKPSELGAFLATGRTGPLWYRGYFPDVAQGSAYPLATDEHVSAALAHFEVEQILVGHTVVDRVKPLYSGAVIAVQVYPRRDEHSGRLIAEAAVWQQGRWHRARIDGSRDPL
jgi:hypothetical protein